MKTTRDHISAHVAIDGQFYQVEIDCVPPSDPDADEFWIATDVRDMSDNMFWSIDPMPMGSTPGECLDAVIKEASR